MSDRPRRWRWRVLAVVSLALAVTGGLVIWTGTGTGPPPSALRSPPTTSVKGTLRPGPTTSPNGALRSPPTTANPALIDRQPPVGPESTMLGAPQGTQGPTLVIPAIGIDAAIIPEGIDETPGDVGNLSAPDSAGEVGWWDGGPAPGQAGVSVITGHRVSDWAFWRLPDLQPGDAVEVIGANGQTTHWTVTSTQQLPKSQLPASVWSEGGPARLALVTCGGSFDYSIGHYADNVLVWAEPAQR